MTQHQQSKNFSKTTGGTFNGMEFSNFTNNDQQHGQPSFYNENYEFNQMKYHKLNQQRSPNSSRFASPKYMHDADNFFQKQDTSAVLSDQNIIVTRIYNPQSMYKQFSLDLSIYYQTKLGESLAVIGSIEELGCWKIIKKHMKWSEGHIWVLDQPIFTQKSFFKYKYVLLYKGELIKWEDGIDRILDFEILQNSNNIFDNSNFYQADTKYCKLKDHWEKFQLRLSVYHPNQQAQEPMYINVQQSNNESQGIKKNQQKMEIKHRNEGWLLCKYGKEVSPYSYSLEIENKDGDNCGQWKNGKYIIEYFFKTNSGKERDPKRILQIMDPANYQGQLGLQKNSHQYGDKVFVVNGMIDKCDGNFIPEFYFVEIIQPQLVIGSYPQSQSDILKLRQVGVTAVFDIQTFDQSKSRQINQERMLNLYRQCEIKQIVQFPINDYDEQVFAEQISQAAYQLQQLIHQHNHKVFVHCTTGFSRAPALAIVYLSVYVKNKMFSNILDVENHVQKMYGNHNRRICPNMKIVKKVVAENMNFINEDLEQNNQEERLRLQEQERIRLLKIAEEEKAKLQQIRQKNFEQLAFEEAEMQRKRIQLAISEEKEKQKILQLKEEQEKYRLLKLQEEQEYLSVQKKKMQDEQNRIRLQTEQEQEFQKIQKKKIEDELAEQLRLKKIQEEEQDFIRQQRIKIEEEHLEQIRLKKQAETDHQNLFIQQRKLQEEEIEKLRIERQETERLRLLIISEKQQIEEQIEKLRIERQEIERLRLLIISEKQQIEEQIEKLRIDRQEIERLRQLIISEKQQIEQNNESNQLQNKKSLTRQKSEIIKVDIKEEQMTTSATKKMQQTVIEDDEALNQKQLIQLESQQIEDDHQKKLSIEAENEIIKLNNSIKTIKNKFQGNDMELNEIKEISFKNQNCAFGDADLLGWSEAELDAYCDHLFQIAPIQFIPRQDNMIDQYISLLIKQLRITIPILFIKEKLYLIGSVRINVDMKTDNLILRVGGGFEKFSEYVPKNHRFFERSLVVLMIKSGESLGWVVNKICQGKKIKNILRLQYENQREIFELYNDPAYFTLSTIEPHSSLKKSSSPKRMKPSKSPYFIRGFSLREFDPYSKTKSASMKNLNKNEESKQDQSQSLQKQNILKLTNHKIQIHWNNKSHKL